MPFAFYEIGRVFSSTSFLLRSVWFRKMKSKTNETMQRAQMMDRVKGDGPNWILIAGGALLSTLLIRIGCKLKQALKTKGLNKDARGNKNTAKPRLGVCQLHSNLYQFTPDKEGCYNFISGHANGGMQIKLVSDNPTSKDSELSLPLVKISAAEFNKDSNGGTMWASSPELLELLPHKPFHHSTGSNSPSISESGSDIYTKREVINKLRQQLKKRDEMIMDMQNQIPGLQNSLCAQMSLVAQTQSQLDSANQELFESEREIQRLRKIIADHCILKSNSPEKPAPVANRRPEIVNGFPDGAIDLDLHCVGAQKGRGDEERMGLLKKELGDLRVVIEGKDFLLQSYREQKSELCSTIKVLEQRLESHQHNIF